jgi:NADPH-dependent glutamate synthase beta subunit-like oxidoreductase
MPAGGHNLAWLASNFSCRAACPVGTNAGGYVSLISAGRPEEAYALTRRPNPMASVCGLICAHPCEDACRRATQDEPISIRALKRYATERFGIESKRSFEEILEVVERPRPVAESPGRVAVIGTGPAGIACAHDLALMGHKVTIFDAAEVPGGMLRLGIPDYRLPPEILQREIDFVEFLGVEFRMGTEIGVEISFAQLRTDYDAVFLATGCRKGRGLPVEGADHPEVLTAVDFLAQVNLGHEIKIGDNVLVIGGGNVAFDAARSARRIDSDEEQAEAEADEANAIHTALDTARLAQISLKKSVTMISLESREELPADDVELEEGEEEGIVFHHRVSPQRIVVEDGKVVGVEVLDVSRVFDENGRFSPQTVEGSSRTISADTVIVAIGQVADLSFLGDDHGLNLTPRSTLIVDLETGSTNVAGVYAGGDVAFGPRIAILAVRDGRHSALAIDSHITGRKSKPKQVVVRQFRTFGYDHPFAVGDYEKITRRRIPSKEVVDRMSGQQVELGYSDDQARTEAARCLRCWINTVFDSTAINGTQCIQCGGCVDVCPEACIDLVRVAHIAADPQPKTRFILPGGSTSEELAAASPGAALIKNEDACIRCGLCARRCPVGCVTMQGFYLEDEMALVRLAETSV